MTLPEQTRRELSALFWSLQEGSFTPGDVERLERLAAEYPEVRTLYAQFMVMCGVLQWERAAPHAAFQLDSPKGPGFKVQSSGEPVGRGQSAVASETELGDP